MRGPRSRAGFTAKPVDGDFLVLYLRLFFCHKTERTCLSAERDADGEEDEEQRDGDHARAGRPVPFVGDGEEDEHEEERPDELFKRALSENLLIKGASQVRYLFEERACVVDDWRLKKKNRISTNSPSQSRP